MRKTITRAALIPVLITALYAVFPFPVVSCLALETNTVEKAARFEPTSPAIVDEMLKIADVGKNDVVYDLGSETAALSFQLRGKKGPGASASISIRN